MTEVEVERLVVRLTGDGSSFQQMIQQSVQSIQPAVNHIEAAARRIEGFSRSLQGFASSALSVLSGFGVAVSFQGAFEKFAQFETSQIRLRAVIEAGGHEAISTMEDYKQFTESILANTLQTRASVTAALQKAEVMGHTGEKSKELVRMSVALSGVLGGEASQHIRIASMIKDGNLEYAKRILGLRGIKDPTELAAKVQGQLNAGWRIATEEGASAAGQITRLKRSFNELTIQVGGFIADAIEPVVQWLSKTITWFKSLDEATRAMTVKVILGTIAVATLSFVLAPVVGVIVSLLTPIASFALLMGTLAVRTAIYLPIQALGLALWLSWKIAVISATVVMAIYNTSLATFSFLLSASAIASGTWTAGILIAKAATWLWNAALTVLNVLIAPASFLAVVATVAVLGAAFVVVSGIVMGVIGAFMALREGLRNIFAETSGPVKAVSGIFNEWWDIIKDIVVAVKTDMPLAGKIMWAAFQLAISQVRDLWPPLWIYVKSSFYALWELVSERFVTEFEIAQARIKEAAAERLGWLDTEEHKNNRKIWRDALEGSKRVQDMMFAARMANANNVFDFEESFATKSARNRLNELREELEAKLNAPDVAKNDPLGLGSQQEELKKTTHELHKYDAALHGSSESIARIAAFRDKMAMVVKASETAVAPAVAAKEMAKNAEGFIQHDPELAKQNQALVKEGLEQVKKFNEMTPEKQKEWVEDQKTNAQGLRLAEAITPYLKQLVELARENLKESDTKIGFINFDEEF